ncbi:MAG: imidazole glycerol phosphate synthase subunit HisF [Vampirovibrionales bacterium]|nr:imidazole glycerol phosphate synthase subunit HisF [Vampirovibrionales bacterium]
MLCKRIIPCLDVANGRTVKGVNFEHLRDMGDPVAMALAYQNQGADELVFLDITASVEDRGTTIQLVQRVARELMIPFTVGGGIRTVDDAYRLLEAGADKVSVNTAAVTNPQLMTDIATAFGNQCCVLAIDARQMAVNATHSSTTPNDHRWAVLTHGGRKVAELDALSWAQQAVTLGAGEILLTSWDKDGTRSGFDIALTQTLATQLSVPVIASGGAHNAQSFVDVFTDGCADAALAASLFHDGDTTVQLLKQTLAAEGIAVRL